MHNSIEEALRGVQVIDDVSVTTKDILWKQCRRQTIGVIALSVALAVADFFIFNAGGILIFFILPLCIWYGYGIQTIVHRQFMQQFANANGFIFSNAGTIKGEVGALFSIGRDRSISNIISGSFKDRPLRLFNYQYTTGSGKSSNVHYLTVFDLEFKTTLSRMYLDARQDGEFIADSVQKIELESNEFREHFSLYITPGKQIEALQVFTPDLMAELIDLPNKYDIELVGNQIYIYADGTIQTKTGLKNLYTVAQHVITNVGLVAERIKY